MNAPATPAAAVNHLRARGLRVSAARRALVEALYAADGPARAEELAGNADVTAVYRNLEALEGAGLVSHVHFGHGARRYALAGDAEYALCERCGEVRTLQSADLAEARAAIARACGIAVHFTHFPLAGLCAACAAAPAAQPG